MSKIELLLFPPTSLLVYSVSIDNVLIFSVDLPETVTLDSALFSLCSVNRQVTFFFLIHHCKILVLPLPLQKNL